MRRRTRPRFRRAPQSRGSSGTRVRPGGRSLRVAARGGVRVDATTGSVDLDTSRDELHVLATFGLTAVSEATPSQVAVEAFILPYRRPLPQRFAGRVDGAGVPRGFQKASMAPIRWHARKNGSGQNRGSCRQLRQWSQPGSNRRPPACKAAPTVTTRHDARRRVPRKHTGLGRFRG
jgi:hypothetical protein